MSNTLLLDILSADLCIMYKVTTDIVTTPICVGFFSKITVFLYACDFVLRL